MAMHFKFHARKPNGAHTRQLWLCIIKFVGLGMLFLKRFFLNGCTSVEV